MRELFKKITKRDINSLFGTFFKNSTFQFSNIMISKVGSFLFTLFLARILFPEMFGIYSLTLSIIAIFTSFSDMGVNKLAVVLLSKENKQKNYKNLANYIFRLKIKIMLIIAVLLGFVSYPISLVYGKPLLFVGLIAGVVYVIFSGISTLIESFLNARQDFKSPMFKELLFQILRLIILLPAIFILIKLQYSSNIVLFSLFSLLSILYLITALFLFSKLGNLKSLLNRENKISLSKKQKTKKLLYPLSLNAISEIFFSYFDLIILGFFVLPAYLGYYQVALTFISIATPFSSLALVLLPIFGTLKGNRLKNVFKKSSKYLFLITLLLSIFIFIFSGILVNFLYGGEYAFSTNILKILTPLFILVPMTTLYYNYLISVGKQVKVSIMLISTSLLNIILNLVLILLVFKSNPTMVVFGVAGVSVLSKTIYLIGLRIIEN